MTDNTKLFISHTTQDERDHRLAHLLANGLRIRGAQVWIAPGNISAGSKWEKEIISSITKECTHFLVILSAASTRAEWVLKEIGLAKKRLEDDSTFKILPLAVGKLGKYAGKTFIDQFQWIPYHREFSAQLNAVARELGLPPNIPDQFRSFIESRTEGFVGREYVFAALDEFIRKKDRGYFIIQGDPGEGKSAIAAEYVKRTGCVAHFNIRSEGITRSNQFLDNICTQVVSRFGLSETLARPEKAKRKGSSINSPGNARQSSRNSAFLTIMPRSLRIEYPRRLMGSHQTKLFGHKQLGSMSRHFRVLGPPFWPQNELFKETHQIQNNL